MSTGNGSVAGRRSGRRAGESSTKDEILSAARSVFAQYGYRGATMRMIAKEARVDAALIHHFFTSKAGVYAASIESAFDLRGLIDAVLVVPREDAGRELIRGFLGIWENTQSRDPILAVVRSAVSHEDAATMLTDYVIAQALVQIVTALDVPEPELRATLISSQLIGLAFLRYVLRAEPLASTSATSIMDWLTPTIDRYLTGEAPGT